MGLWSQQRETDQVDWSSDNADQLDTPDMPANRASFDSASNAPGSEQSSRIFCPKLPMRAPSKRMVGQTFLINITSAIFVAMVCTLPLVRQPNYAAMFHYLRGGDPNLWKQFKPKMAQKMLSGGGGTGKVYAGLAVIAIAAVSIVWVCVDFSKYPGLIVALALASLALAFLLETYGPYCLYFGKYFKYVRATPPGAWGWFGLLLLVDAALAGIFVAVPFVFPVFALLGYSWLVYGKAIVYLKIFSQVRA
ncbi:hypothetical protein KIMH_02470 [Bombiscardovia apis]|uniref:Beta-carotene 15,15'-monooxygenase n=1 Tax=Bombiscardovia apis TaxID=2932182 RepID=A0ABN6SFX1_9BIFI|nr:hypothetical protein [Bombiscardovia apis]BDR54136.1 hypothetical protein KIMH_02470 [Bombiscardovia apis]